MFQDVRVMQYSLLYMSQTCNTKKWTLHVRLCKASLASLCVQPVKMATVSCPKQIPTGYGLVCQLRSNLAKGLELNRCLTTQGMRNMLFKRNFHRRGYKPMNHSEQWMLSFSSVSYLQTGQNDYKIYLAPSIRKLKTVILSMEARYLLLYLVLFASTQILS